MAWTAPITATANSVFTASQWNASVRDNLLMTAPAISTTNGYLLVSSATNTISERQCVGASVNTSATTTSATYAAPTTGTAGPAVTTVTGHVALTFFATNISSSSTPTALAAVAVSGATTVAATDARSLIADGPAAKDDRAGITTGFMALTDGSNTFTLQYRIAGAATATYAQRRIVAMPCS